jgi:hypothetical protein
MNNSAHNPQKWRATAQKKKKEENRVCKNFDEYY